jgi:hypothetical protein
MDPKRARELLRETEADLENVERQAKALRNLVANYRTLAGEDPTPQPTVARRAVGTVRRRGRNAGPGLKTVLEGMLRERGRMSITEAMEALAEMPAYAHSMPNRNTVGSRLGDLVRDGKADNVDFGEYEWLATNRNGSAQHDSPTQAALEGAVQVG